ncbi:MAG TPA: CvpA family protein [Burkholderiaceae bacterium]|nr:CvpA family protein [Burkholderiaceae bacterium]
MVAVDWILLAALLLSMALGAWRGLVYEVLSVLAWLAAFVAAQWFAPEVAKALPMGNASEPVRYAAGFVVVFIGAVFAGGLLAWMVKKLVEAVGLRPIDRMLGMLFGLARGVILLLAVAIVVGMTPLRTNPWWQESKGAGMLTAALSGLKPMLPEAFARYMR